MASMLQVEEPRTKDFADPAFEDELLVELAEAGAAVAQVDGELAGIGYGAAASDCERGCAGEGFEPVTDAVPTDPGAEVAEGFDFETAGDQFEHGLEGGGESGADRGTPA